MQLAHKRCVPCHKGAIALSVEAVQALLPQVNGWHVSENGKAIVKVYKFKNFAQALAFVNVVGTVAETENHHPDIAFGWGYVNITLQTHSIGGLHENDFVMAAKIDALQ